MWSRSPLAGGCARAKCAAPLIARVLAAVAPEVKTIFSRVGADQLGDIGAGGVDRHAIALLPATWLSLCGLPKCSVK